MIKDHPPQAQDIRQLHKQFLQYSQYVRNLSPSTLRDYKLIFNLLLTYSPNLSAQLISPDLLVNFFIWLQTRERVVGHATKTSVKKSTIATYWLKLNIFLEWLTQKRVLSFNPLKQPGMQRPNPRYDDKKFLNRADVEKILAAVVFKIPWKNNFLRARNTALLSVLINCGLRRGELLALMVTDFDLLHNELTVRSETSKSRASRRIPLNSRVRRDIDTYLELRRASQVQTNYFWVSDNFDDRLSLGGFRHLIEQIRLASGVKFHPHQLRHTFAVNFLHNSGQNSFKLQGLLGHRNIISTAIYTRCLPQEAVREDMERLASLENSL